MKMHDEKYDISKDDLASYNRFYKLRCRVLRKHVFHGVKEEDGVQTVTCLSCGDTYKFHNKGRNKIEVSLWEAYEKHSSEMNLKSRPERRPKKRWNHKYLFSKEINNG